MNKKSTWFPEAKPKKQKNTPNTFPFFVLVISDRFLMCSWLFQMFFHQQRPTPKNNTPPILLPTFCFTHEKKWPGKRRIFQSTFTKPKGIVQPMVGVFFSIKNTLFLVEIHHLPGGCRRIMLDFFFGDTFWDDWLGVVFWKESGSTKKNPMEHPWTWMEWVEFRSYEIRKNMYTTMRYPDSDWQWQ